MIDPLNEDPRQNFFAQAIASAIARSVAQADFKAGGPVRCVYSAPVTMCCALPSDESEEVVVHHFIVGGRNLEALGPAHQPVVTSSASATGCVSAQR